LDAALLVELAAQVAYERVLGFELAAQPVEFCFADPKLGRERFEFPLQTLHLRLEMLQPERRAFLRRRRSGLGRLGFAFLGRFRSLGCLPAMELVAKDGLWKFAGDIELVRDEPARTSVRARNTAGVFRCRIGATDDRRARRTRCSTRGGALDGGVVGLVAGVPACVIGHCGPMEASRPNDVNSRVNG
jgi:hypothetical protein